MNARYKQVGKQCGKDGSPDDTSRSSTIVLLLCLLPGCLKDKPSKPGEIFDAGRILVNARQEKTLSHVFRIKNTTGQSVRILDVIPSCTCSSYTLSRYDLAPRESAELELRAKLPDTYSKTEISCLIKTDSPQYPEWPYALRFESLPRIMINPLYAHLGVYKRSDFDEAGSPRSGKAPLPLTIDCFSESGNSDDLEPTVNVGEDLNARLRPTGSTDRLERGIWHRGTLVEVSLDHLSDGSTGTQSRSLTATSRAGSSASAMVSWRLDLPITVSPTALSFGTVTCGEPSASRRLLIRATEGASFKILSIKCESTRAILSKPFLKHRVTSLAKCTRWRCVSSPGGNLDGETLWAASARGRLS